MDAFAVKNRRTLRAPINPLDKCTIVSIYPRRIVEYRDTIVPRQYILEPGSMDNPSRLVVGPASWWREIDESQPLLEITVSSIQVANSIVRDYCSGVVAGAPDAIPGLFFIQGEIGPEILKKNHTKELELANTKQKKWYADLIKQADSLWARSGSNPLAIPDAARLAAEQLNMKDKAWMGDFKHLELSNCPGCGHMINPKFPICANCKTIINHEMWAKSGLKQAV